jgi:hypothetical protein
MSHHWATRKDNTSGRDNGHLPKADLKTPILHATDSNHKWCSGRRERQVCDRWIRSRRMGSIALIRSQIWPLDPVWSSSGPPRPGSCQIILLIPWGHPSTSLPPLGRFGNTVLHPCQACAHALARRIHVARRHNHGACKLRSSATTLLPTAKHFMAAGKRSSTNGVGIDSLITSFHEHNYY